MSPFMVLDLGFTVPEGFLWAEDGKRNSLHNLNTTKSKINRRHFEMVNFLVLSYLIKLPNKKGAMSFFPQEMEK